MELKPEEVYTRKISFNESNTGVSAKLNLPLKSLDAINVTDDNKEVKIFKYPNFLVICNPETELDETISINLKYSYTQFKILSDEIEGLKKRIEILESKQ